MIKTFISFALLLMSFDTLAQGKSFTNTFTNFVCKDGVLTDETGLSKEIGRLEFDRIPHQAHFQFSWAEGRVGWHSPGDFSMTSNDPQDDTQFSAYAESVSTWQGKPFSTLHKTLISSRTVDNDHQITMKTKFVEKGVLRLQTFLFPNGKCDWVN